MNNAPFVRFSKFLILSSVAAATLLNAHISYAYTGDVIIDNLKIVDKETTAIIKHIEVLGSNLEKPEIIKLFETSTKSEERTALLSKLQANKFSIPEIQITGKNELKALFKDLLATNINKGKIGTLTLTGFEGADKTEKGSTSVKVGAILMESVDLSKALEAARTGKPPEAMDIQNQASKISINTISILTPDEETPKDAASNLRKFNIASVEGITEPSPGTSQKGTFEIKNATVEFPKESFAGKALKEYGYDKLDMSMKMRVTVDTVLKKFNLEELTLSGVNIGALTFAGKLENFVQASFGASHETKYANLMEAGISSIQVSFVNLGGFDKAVVQLATQQGAKPEDLKAQWSAMAVGMLPAILAGDPAGKTIGEAVAKFIGNPKNVTIGATSKGAALPVSSFQAAKSPADVLSKINVTASANQ